MTKQSLQHITNLDMWVSYTINIQLEILHQFLGHVHQVTLNLTFIFNNNI